MTDETDSRFIRTINRFFDWVADDEEEDEEIVRVHVEHYIHDRSIKERLYIFMIRDLTTSFWLRLLRFFVKFASCILFVAVAITGKPYCAEDGLTDAEPRENCSEYLNLVWVERPIYFWGLQFVVAVLCLLESALLIYIHYSGGKIWAVFDIYIVLDILVGVPFLLPIFYWPLWKLWVPSYLNCWSAKYVIERMFFDLHRSSQSHRYARERKLLMLLLTVVCLMFTSACTIHHLQKVDKPGERWDFFVSIWFIVVTFSTVGYGKIAPEMWSSRLFVIIIIIVALVVVPKQVNDYLEIRKSQKQHGEATAFALAGRHVVVCATELRQSDLRDFLAEFFAYKEKVQEFTVVVLSPNELSEELKLLIQVPLWSKRVLYLQGSALKEQDLLRARVRDAEGCFLLVNRRTSDRDRADQRTVLRAWSIYDIAPDTPLFVQILKPENKPLVSFANAVLCEDQLKYSLLANNCYCKGISTLVTILLHTSREKAGSRAIPWHKLYGSCSGNEIYSVVLGDSRVFRTFAGKNFLFTSVMSRRKYGITLIGVRRGSSNDILLNPGRRFVLHFDDVCYYLSIAREENSKFITEQEALPHVRPALRRTLAFAGTLAVDMTMLNNISENAEQDVIQGRETSAMETSSSHPHEREGLQSYCQYVKASIPDDSALPSDEVVRDLHRLRALAVGKGSGAGKKNKTKREVEHFEGPNVDNVKQTTGVVSSLITSTMHFGMTAVPTAVNAGQRDDTEVHDEIVEIDRVTHTDVSHISRDFHGMDALDVKAEGQRRKQDFLYFPSHPAAHHGSLASLSSGHGSDRASRASSKKLSHGGSQSSVALPPSVIAPVALDDVIEEHEELSDDEREELQDLEVGSLSDSSGIVDDLPQPEAGIPWVSPMEYRKGVPSQVPYIGMQPLQCYLLPETTPLCCLHLTKPCEHTEDNQSVMTNWKTGSVIISGSYTCNGIYHFILPLRAHYIPRCTLRPIVLLLENEPDQRFLEAISCFPQIYYLIGSPNDIDDLLRAGILCAHTIVVVRNYDVASEDPMADAGNIIALQKIFRIFPETNVVTELSTRQNIRFTKFRWSWTVGQKVECDNPLSSASRTRYERVGMKCARVAPASLSRDHMTYMFRPAFAAGNVFTASMLDTLLYQSYVKPWIIPLVEQLLGCRQVNGSGFLWQIPVDGSLASLKTYGRVCQRLAQKFGLLVFGVYRTVQNDQRQQRIDTRMPSSCEKVLKDRMQYLGISGEPPERRERGDSFVLVNPKPDLQMQSGDRLYVICPGKYVVSDNPDDEPGIGAADEHALGGDMPVLPSFEPFDVELKGKESPRSSRLMWTISRFLFRRQRPRNTASKNKIEKLEEERQYEEQAWSEEKQRSVGMYSATAV
ncbi:potassium channel subfamily T member 2-like isoform X2 [Corticium candelabrum]|uniref:potassium channel subfamily T member 2-like isoform X2 n=1 Tax=Corticium candelabrum TaxID=121492 RepID=UPI002E2555FE|nr:potassium channel subfamily T member 2-like isoform X2 [Corticium candelabrum]